MHDKEALCERMKYLLPDLGECGIDFHLDWDSEKEKWMVTIWKNEKKVTTWIDENEADMCMDNKICVGLLSEIAKFKADVVSSDDP